MLTWRIMPANLLQFHVEPLRRRIALCGRGMHGVGLGKSYTVWVCAIMFNPPAAEPRCKLDTCACARLYVHRAAHERPTASAVHEICLSLVAPAPSASLPASTAPNPFAEEAAKPAAAPEPLISF